MDGLVENNFRIVFMLTEKGSHLCVNVSWHSFCFLHRKPPEYKIVLNDNLSTG